MNQKLIDWNLERAAEESRWAGIAESRVATGAQYAGDADDAAECRHHAGMHIAAANQQAMMLDEIERLRKDAARLDWLADVNNTAGAVTLPTACVVQHMDDMRCAIDCAMGM